MERAHHEWDSPILQRKMELLVFGHAGARVLFFPTRKARYYDYENWGVIESLKDKIEQGFLQIICVDSLDRESFYATQLAPCDRILRHLQYEKYIIDEVLPFSRKLNKNMYMAVAGCSLGAYHAVNIAFRHPEHFGKVVGMSGRYDLTQPMSVFKDLFEGFVDENIYLNTPNRYIPNLQDQKYLQELRRLEIVVAIGKHDAFIEDNKFLSHSLWEKGIANQIHFWEGEAHDPMQWREMVQFYF
ncbi:MAG: esterase family protein [Cytophagales bacterium]